MYSVSPFVPAILFTTAAGTTVPTVTMTPSGLDLTAAAQTVKAGETVQLTLDLTGTVSPDGHPIEVLPDAAIFTIGIMREDASIQDVRTWVDEYGVLHAGEKLETGDVITVTATSAYINPSGATTKYTDTVTVTVE